MDNPAITWASDTADLADRGTSLLSSKKGAICINNSIYIYNFEPHQAKFIKDIAVVERWVAVG